MYRKLKANSVIGVVGVSHSVSQAGNEDVFARAVDLFAENGFKLKFADNCTADYYGMAGTPKQKAADLMAMFLDDEVDMIICLQGGDSCNTLIDYLDYDAIKKHAKPIMGYSDITVVLETIYKKTGLITFHGPDFMSFCGKHGEQSMEELKKAFVNGDFSSFTGSELRAIREGDCKGKMIGTNLECSSYIMDTEYFPSLKNNIFAIEKFITSPRETYSYFYRLKHRKVFDKISGMIIGYNYSFQSEEYGKIPDIQMEDIALEVSEGYDFPIYKCETFGHCIANVVIPIGAKFEVKKNQLILVDKIMK